MIRRLTKGLAKQQGSMALIMVVVVLAAAAIISFFTAQMLIAKQQTFGNHYNNQRSFAAAQAGLNYGVVYLDKYRATITDGATASATLSNGSSYSVTFTFVGNKDKINIQSVGTSTNGKATTTLTETVQWVGSSGGASIPSTPVRAVGSLDMSSNAIITNTINNITSVLGGVAELASNAKTILDSGVSSTSGNIQSDIIQGDSDSAAMSSADLEIATLGETITSLHNSTASAADIVHNYSSNHDYSSQVNGQTGVTIAMNQAPGTTAIVSSNTIIGSSSNPVTLVITGNVSFGSNTRIYGNIIVLSGNVNFSSNVIVEGHVISNGSISMSSNTHIYGLVFASGTQGVTMSSNVIVDGAVVSGGSVIMSSNARVVYDLDTLNDTTIFPPSSAGNYGIIPGSWTDL